MDVNQDVKRGRERRQSSRYCLSQPVMVRDAESLSSGKGTECLLAQTKDISSWGVGVKLDKANGLQVGKEVRLRMYPLPGLPFVESQGTIRWMVQTSDPLYPLQMGVDLNFFSDLSSMHLWNRKIENLGIKSTPGRADNGGFKGGAA